MTEPASPVVLLAVVIALLLVLVLLAVSKIASVVGRNFKVNMKGFGVTLNIESTDTGSRRVGSSVAGKSE